MQWAGGEGAAAAARGGDASAHPNPSSSDPPPLYFLVERIVRSPSLRRAAFVFEILLLLNAILLTILTGSLHASSTDTACVSSIFGGELKLPRYQLETSEGAGVPDTGGVANESALLLSVEEGARERTARLLSADILFLKVVGDSPEALSQRKNETLDGYGDGVADKGVEEREGVCEAQENDEEGQCGSDVGIDDVVGRGKAPADDMGLGPLSRALLLRFPQAQTDVATVLLGFNDMILSTCRALVGVDGTLTAFKAFGGVDWMLLFFGPSGLYSDDVGTEGEKSGEQTAGRVAVSEHNYAFSEEEGFLMLSRTARQDHNVTKVNVALSKDDPCFGSVVIREMLFQIMGYDAVLANTLYFVKGNGFLYSQRSNALLTIGLGKGNVDAVNAGVGVLGVVFGACVVSLLTGESVNRLVIDSIVVVPSIVVGLLFFLDEFYGNQGIAFCIVVMVWLSEMFSMFVIRGVHGSISHNTISISLLAPVVIFNLYYFTFNFGYHYLALITVSAYVEYIALSSLRRSILSNF